MNDAEIANMGQPIRKDKELSIYKFDKPGKEEFITQEIRQMAF